VVPVAVERPRRQLPPRQAVYRKLPAAVIIGAVGFGIVWVLFAAPLTGSLGTNFGSATDSPDQFVITLLNGLSFSSELFIVASGFALIFGLMRVVNMAHGSFFLLGAYIAYDMQQYMANNSADLFVPSSSIGLWDWVVPAIVASICIAGLGLVIQQIFLRWNQGQDLRQALITIAISVIIADQVIAHFHFGLAREVTWPGFIDNFTDLRVSFGWTLLIWLLILSPILLVVRSFVSPRAGSVREQLSVLKEPRNKTRQVLELLGLLLAGAVVIDLVLAFSSAVRGWIPAGTHLYSVAGVSYSVIKLVVILLGIGVGLALWLWLYRTRTGMVIRAGVDDRAMTSALGINIQRTFAIAFVVGSALAAFGATVGSSQQNVANGSDGTWLLYALVVVVVGGMGSIFGAVAGSLLFGLVYDFAGAYLPAGATQYQYVFVFMLVALVLAFRPQGLFGRAA
jgi:branched-subunit amino acid ABC-type transport system permease component